MSYLTGTLANMSLADVTYDGPIEQRTFRSLLISANALLGSGAVISTTYTPETFDNVTAIYENSNFKNRFVHQATISLNRNATTTPQWTVPVLVPQAALSSIYVDYDKDENSPGTNLDDTYRSRLTINGVVAANDSAFVFQSGDSANLHILHQSPTEFGITDCAAADKFLLATPAKSLRSALMPINSPALD